MEKGRPIDVPHTKAVVYYAGLIAADLELDPVVMRTVAWLHDIGYYGQFAGVESGQYGVVMGKKEKHMVVGAEMARKFVNSPEIANLLTDGQKRTSYTSGGCPR